MKARYILYLISIILFLDSCQDNEFMEKQGNGLRVIASFADTRTVFTENNNVMTVSWETEDEIGLFSDEQLNIRYHAKNQGKNAEFAPTNLSLKAQEGDSVFAYYPYAELREYEVNRHLLMLPETYRQYYTTDAADMDFIYADGIVKNNAVNLQFEHAFAFLRITLPSELLAEVHDGGLYIESTELCSASEITEYFLEKKMLNARNSQILYYIPDSIIATQRDITCNIVIFPQTEKAALTFYTFSSDENGYPVVNDREVLLSKKAPENGFKAGNFYTLYQEDSETEVRRQKEREALIAFYKATGGDNWKNNTNWCSEKPVEEWYGINHVDYHGYVRMIRLFGNSLTGSIPPEIKDIEGLWELELGNNSITGIAPEISELKELYSLSLRTNLLTSIPDEIGQMKSLTSLDLAANKLSGSFPEVILQVDNLKGIYLGGNNLTGSIPEEIGKLKLVTLNLAENKLTGSLPSSLANCPLTSLTVSDNQLSGNVPDIFNTPEMYSVDLSNNQFTGSLPELGENVVHFWAINNQFTGSIPASHARVLQHEDYQYEVYYNNLTGEVPSWLAKSEDFHFLWFNNLRQNAGYGFNKVDIPAHRNTVKCYDGSFINLGEEYAKNEYTILFRWDPYCPFSVTYPPKFEQLRKKYEEKGLGIINMTPQYHTSDEIAPLVKQMPETPIFWEANSDIFTNLQGEYNNNPYDENRYFYLFRFGATPYFFVVDKSGNIIFFGSGEVEAGTIPQYHENRDEIFNFVANLFGDEEFVPEDTEYYTSTDYSRDGEVLTLQEASLGKGIDLVFLGEAFVDKDMGDGGLYEQKMKEGMEQFFAYEPYRSLRNRFNVYAVKVVSPNAEFAPGAEHSINESDAVCIEYAQKIPGFDQPPMVSVIYNSGYAGRSYTMMYSDGSFFAYVMTGVDNVLNHEAGGHGFAKLLDEYVEYENQTLPEFEKETMDYEWETFGWGANVDWRNDPATVRWSRFLQDDRYSNEGLGLYEGAYLYSFGAYRPTENSMMRYNDSPFNAPSREQIYKTVMQMSEGSSWTYDYEDFVEFDAVSRNAATTRSLRQAPSAAQVEKWKKSHCPPVRMKGTWRDARKESIAVPYR